MGTKINEIVIVQPHFQQGGAETVAAWAIQALKGFSPIKVLTFDRVDAQTLNRNFGTSLQSNDFDVVACNFPFGTNGVPSWTLLKLHWLMRQCKKWPNDRVLFFSTSSEMDFGRPGIQYVDFPQLVERDVRQMGLLTAQKWWHRDSWARKVYLRVGELLSDFSVEGVRANLTLAVSKWTARIVEQIYGVPARTVYPPVTFEFPKIPFKNREPGFVCIGRIVPSKRILEIIEILRKVRNEGYEVHLHIVGPVGDRAYMQKVISTQKRLGSWIKIEGPVERSVLAELVSQHRFGIHGMLNEHFGIAVAEMVKAGCIVFIPNNGGQVEIVDSDDRVLYSTEEEAVEKIARILDNANEQQDLSETMRKLGQRFSAERFIGEVREAFNNFLARL
jgi:glycosyltransferase involved in cell wall biosynthesis